MAFDERKCLTERLSLSSGNAQFHGNSFEIPIIFNWPFLTWLFQSSSQGGSSLSLSFSTNLKTHYKHCFKWTNNYALVSLCSQTTETANFNSIHDIINGARKILLIALLSGTIVALTIGRKIDRDEPSSIFISHISYPMCTYQFWVMLNSVFDIHCGIFIWALYRNEIKVALEIMPKMKSTWFVATHLSFWLSWTHTTERERKNKSPRESEILLHAPLQKSPHNFFLSALLECCSISTNIPSIRVTPRKCVGFSFFYRQICQTLCLNIGREILFFIRIWIESIFFLLIPKYYYYK